MSYLQPVSIKRGRFPWRNKHNLFINIKISFCKLNEKQTVQGSPLNLTTNWP